VRLHGLHEIVHRLAPDFPLGAKAVLHQLVKAGGHEKLGQVQARAIRDRGAHFGDAGQGRVLLGPIGVCFDQLFQVR
jgi:hypothetical protein